MSTAPIAALHGVGYNGGLDMSELREMMQKQQQEDTERAMNMFMENARNAMRAVKIAIEEGDDEEALRLIDEALGNDA